MAISLTLFRGSSEQTRKGGRQLEAINSVHYRSCEHAAEMAQDGFLLVKHALHAEHRSRLQAAEGRPRGPGLGGLQEGRTPGCGQDGFSIVRL
jgi:hypothetical protein